MNNWKTEPPKRRVFALTYTENCKSRYLVRQYEPKLKTWSPEPLYNETIWWTELPIGPVHEDRIDVWIAIADEVNNDIEEYSNNAWKTANSFLEKQLQLASFGLGIAGEAGEVADLIKKHVGHDHELNMKKLVHELGDVLWYVNAICKWTGVKLADVLDENIKKLAKRYPNGFSNERSKNRKE